MIIHDDLQDLFRYLNARAVEYVVVGGYAVAFHGFIRATKDIDILYRNSSTNISRISRALVDFGIDPSQMDAGTFSEPGRIVRIGSPPMMVELINGIGGVEFDEVWETRERGTYGACSVPFISRELLMKSKIAVGRPHDLRDIEELNLLGGDGHFE